MGIDKKAYHFYLDETAEILHVISVSAGQRGLQMLLAGPDLAPVTQAHLAPICK